jgi:hypothetical protein
LTYGAISCNILPVIQNLMMVMSTKEARRWL